MEINAVKGGARKKFEMVYFIIIQNGQNSQNDHKMAKIKKCIFFTQKIVL